MNPMTDAAFDELLAEWVDRAADGGDADAAVAAALERTARIRPRPGWLVAGQRGLELAGRWSRPARVAVLVAVLLLLAVAVAILVGGSQRRLPPPFGPARSGLIAYESGGHLWIADADGESARQLTFGATDELAPVWSRDGTKLAYRRLTSDEPPDDPGRFNDLLVLDPQGEHEVTILSHARFLSNPTWSPDSRSIAFTQSVASGLDRLFVAAADGSSIADLGDLGGGAWGPSWSPDGTRIAVAAGNEVALVDRDGSGRQVVSRGSYPEVGSQGIVGDWSPTGDAFVFAAGSVDLKRVYLTFLDGRPEVPIGLPDRNQLDPSWSPDGSRIAYLRASWTGLGPSVVIADRAGQDLRVLDGYYAFCTPIWSPDGTRIIVYDDRPGVANRPGPGIVLALDPDGREPPIELSAPQGVLTNDNIAGSWQRLAP